MTLVGIMQGECLSAILFIYYFAQALTVQERNDHNYTIESTSQVKWKHTEGENFTISPKHEDDLPTLKKWKHNQNNQRTCTAHANKMQTYKWIMVKLKNILYQYLKEQMY